MDEISHLIRLKLSTLWIKLRDYEYLVEGKNRPDEATMIELGMDTLRLIGQSKENRSLRSSSKGSRSDTPELEQSRRHKINQSSIDRAFRPEEVSDPRDEQKMYQAPPRANEDIPPPLHPRVASERGQKKDSLASSSSKIEDNSDKIKLATLQMNAAYEKVRLP